MKEKLMNNFGFKVLALCLASLLWIVIINIDDPVDTKTFNSLEVSVYNEDAIKSLDQVYEIVSGANVNVTVKAKKSVLRRMRAEDIMVMADLSEVLPTHAVPIKLTCPKFETTENIELSSNIEVLKITLEDIATEQFKVIVDTGGSTLENGYAIGEVKVKPNLIKVSGAKSQIKRISEVRAEVDASGNTESFRKVVEPKIYDANGKLMDSTKMDFSTNELKVYVEVLETKTVPITIKTEGNPAAGYQFEQADYEPRQIMIAGKSNDLIGVSEIIIPIDITNKSADVEVEINLEKWLPKGTVLVEGTETVTLRLTIAKQKEKQIIFATSDIGIKNLDEKLSVEFLEPGYPLTVKLMGDVELIGNMTIASIGPFLDLKDKKEGNYTLEIQFIDSETLTFIHVPKVKISLKKKQEIDEGDNPNQGITPSPEATIKPTKRPTKAPEKTKKPNQEGNNNEEDNTTDTP